MNFLFLLRYLFIDAGLHVSGLQALFDCHIPTSNQSWDTILFVILMFDLPLSRNSCKFCVISIFYLSNWFKCLKIWWYHKTIVIISGFLWVTQHTHLCYIYPFLSPRMSTMSTVTALAACNHIPGDEIQPLNWMCVLVLTRGDSTLFDATSIQEEDIIELFVEMGQTHLKDVLQFLATESVLLFCSGNKMLVMPQWVTKAMLLCKESIGLHTSPPTTHLRPI